VSIEAQRMNEKPGLRRLLPVACNTFSFVIPKREAVRNPLIFHLPTLVVPELPLIMHSVRRIYDECRDIDVDPWAGVQRQLRHNQSRQMEYQRVSHRFAFRNDKREPVAGETFLIALGIHSCLTTVSTSATAASLSSFETLMMPATAVLPLPVEIFNPAAVSF
jgi:hypothetical protein